MSFAQSQSDRPRPWFNFLPLPMSSWGPTLPQWFTLRPEGDVWGPEGCVAMGTCSTALVSASHLFSNPPGAPLPLSESQARPRLVAVTHHGTVSVVTQPGFLSPFHDISCVPAPAVSRVALLCTEVPFPSLGPCPSTK